MPKVVVRTPFPTLDEVARALRLSDDEQAEVLDRVGTKTGLGVRGSRLRDDDGGTKTGLSPGADASRAEGSRTKMGGRGTRATRRAVVAKTGRVRRAKK